MKFKLKAALAVILALVMALSSLTLGVLAVPEAINEQEIASEAHDPIYFVETGKHLKGADTTPKAIGAGAYYNVDAAVAYARAHALDTPQYPGADCANFTSHCLAAGGITIPNYAYYNSNHPRYDNLGKLNGFTNPYTCSAAQLVYLSEYYPVIKHPSFSQIELGDIVFTNNYDGDPDGHVVIITGFRGNTPLYCGHTNAKLDAPLGSGQAKYAVKMSTYNNLTPPSFAAVSTDKSSYAINEAVTFNIDSDGNINTLWIYLPDGSSTYYENVGSSYQLAFGWAGRYEALVQTWNSLGSYTSESVSFSVGAPTYAAVSTDKDSYAIDEAVYFAINADGNTNTLWIYLPDGSSTYYENIGSSYQLAFGWTGHYEALVQTWNDQGSFISERISFTIGAPTFAAVSTDKDSYAIDEAVYFTINADGNTNTLWVYLPDGSSTYYENVGSSYQLAFGLSGRYEALVQTWNDHVSCISEIVSFSVGILIGDVDSNGNITIADALLALRMAMGILPVSNIEAADIDDNGNISILDALVIMRMSMGTN